MPGVVHRFASPTGHDGARLTTALHGRPDDPTLLWLRPCRAYDLPEASHLPSFLTADGGRAAMLDLPLDWPEDVSASSLRSQIVDVTSRALQTLRDAAGPSSNPTVLVGGHSFGATIALFALASMPQLAAAIVHSGAYNRTLTPTGFQWETRPYWAAREIYHAFSAMMFADRLDRPVLLMHGAQDINPATPPDQAVEFYRGVVAAGGHARLVLLPGEGHNFRYPESETTIVAEHRAWLRRFGEATAGEGVHEPASAGIGADT